jgi:hypothetical protein
MNTSIFLAKVFSLYLLIFGLAVITQRRALQIMFKELLNNKPVVFIFSFLAMIIGILLVVAHPTFTPDWRSLITLFAWLAFIKGILLLFFPEPILNWKKGLMRYNHFYYIAGTVCIILGLYLGYHGFFA